jgi:hypothetical protein
MATIPFPAGPVDDQTFIYDDVTYIYSTALVSWKLSTAAINSGASGSATNIGYTAGTASGTITSSTGTSGTVTLADAVNAGLLIPGAVADVGKVVTVAAAGGYELADAVTLDLNTTIADQSGSALAAAPISPPATPDTGDVHVERYSGNELVYWVWGGAAWAISLNVTAADVNIYNADGTLTGNRTVTGGAFSLTTTATNITDTDAGSSTRTAVGTTALTSTGAATVGSTAANTIVLANGVTYVWPLTDGTAGQVIETDAAGNLSFGDKSSARVHADSTTVAAATAGAPTTAEITVFTAANTVTDAIVYYTGDDLPASVPTYVYHVDSAGSVTLIQEPSDTAKDRSFADETTVAPATAGEPTLAEMTTFIGVLRDTIVYYNGTDVDDSTVTHAYHVDAAGNVTQVQKPSAAGGVHFVGEYSSLAALTPSQDDVAFVERQKAIYAYDAGAWVYGGTTHGAVNFGWHESSYYVDDVGLTSTDIDTGLGSTGNGRKYTIVASSAAVPGTTYNVEPPSAPLGDFERVAIGFYAHGGTTPAGTYTVTFDPVYLQAGGAASMDPLVVVHDGVNTDQVLFEFIRIGINDWHLKYRSDAVVSGATVFAQVADITARDAVTGMAEGDLISTLQPPSMWRYDGAAWQTWNYAAGNQSTKLYADTAIPDDELNPFTTGRLVTMTITAAGADLAVGYPSASFSPEDEIEIQLTSIGAFARNAVFHTVYKDHLGVDIGTVAFSTDTTIYKTLHFRRKTIAVAGTDEYWLVGGTEYNPAGGSHYDLVADLTARDAIVGMASGDMVSTQIPPAIWKYDGAAWVDWYVDGWANEWLYQEDAYGFGSFGPSYSGHRLAIRTTAGGGSYTHSVPLDATWNTDQPNIVELAIDNTSGILFTHTFAAGFVDANGDNVAPLAKTASGWQTYVFQRTATDVWELVGGTEYVTTNVATIYETMRWFITGTPSGGISSVQSTIVGSERIINLDDAQLTVNDPFSLLVLDGTIGDHVLIDQAGTYEVIFSGAPAYASSSYNYIFVNAVIVDSAIKYGSGGSATCAWIGELAVGDKVTFGIGDAATNCLNPSITVKQLPPSVSFLTSTTLVDDQAASGYFDVGTMRMQWGTVSDGNSIGDVTHTLPAAFASTAYVITSTSQTAGQEYAVSARPSTTATFIANKNDTSAATTIWNWIAIGLKP